MAGPYVVAIVLAAGAGKRMAASVNKVFLPVAGRPILAWSLECFERDRSVSEVIIVAAASEIEECRQRVVEQFGLKKVTALVGGGPTRHDSEFCGLLHLQERIDTGSVEIVLIHDAVRPFITAPLVGRVIAEAVAGGAAIPCVRAASTVVRAVPGGQLTTDSADLYAAQTPQAFAAPLVLEAHRRAETDGFKGSDTSSVVEQAGYTVAVVEGSYDNIKITTADDLIRAEQIARNLPQLRGGPSFLTAETASA
ncbi:MAG TPA: 2-C-methyl-D-erythritol 4-phosphate cytidylyltransferase [Candidatus Dormibacteraeota bacterium]